jgi:hypothetical protein
MVSKHKSMCRKQHSIYTGLGIICDFNFYQRSCNVPLPLHPLDKEDWEVHNEQKFVASRLWRMGSTEEAACGKNHFTLIHDMRGIMGPRVLGGRQTD